jgi:hypothetical protein
MPSFPLPALLLATALLIFSLPATARVIEENSFETPRVSGRISKASGGDPTLAPREPGTPPFWQCLEDQPAIGCEGGRLTAGLTTEQARSGTQSLFIEARNLCAPFIGVQWATKAIPVCGKKYYWIVLWGRAAPDSPAPSAPPPLYLNVRVSFYGDEEGQETGECLYLVIPLQGPARKGINTGNWTPLRFGFEAPGSAKFMTVNFQCDGRASKEAINGTVYFDDFSVTEEPPRSGEKTLATRDIRHRHRGNVHSKRLFACRR